MTAAGGSLEAATALADELAAASAGSVEAVLLYGSHLLRAKPDRHSALDFVVVVREYRAFYEALQGAGAMRRPVGLMSALARILPPNVIAYAPGGDEGWIAKCLIVTWEHLEAAVGPRPPDHLLLGRLVQKVALLQAADATARARVDECLRQARRGVLTWMAPYLEGPFDAAHLGRRLLEVCYRGEIRPEARDRSAVVFEAQREHFIETLGPVLEAEARSGRLVREPAGYRLAEPPGRADVRYWTRHFRRSKARATLRWFKHVLTFDNWLPYVQRKAERRLGRPIVLTSLERRWPLIFLWPRAIRVLLDRPDREDKS